MYTKRMVHYIYQVLVGEDVLRRKQVADDGGQREEHRKMETQSFGRGEIIHREPYLQRQGNDGSEHGGTHLEYPELVAGQGEYIEQAYDHQEHGIGQVHGEHHLLRTVSSKGFSLAAEKEQSYEDS